MEGWLYLLAALAVAALAAGLALGLRACLRRLVDRRIAAYQNELIARHCAEVENIYRQMRGWRHDYHNHIQAMQACLALGDTDGLDAYLGRLNQDLARVDTVLKTGNVMVDAILNSKLSLAKARQVAVHAKAAAPKRLTVADVDLCVLLGNLLDNAIEACAGLPDSDARFLRVYLGVLKGQLYISVTNAAGSDIRRAGSGYVSTKGGGHGFGLTRIDRIVEKYGGYVNRQHEPGVFATEVLLPL